MNKKRIKKDKTMNKTNNLLFQRGKLLLEFAENSRLLQTGCVCC